MANLLDRLIGVFDPDAGLRRLRSRSMLVRAYEGAITKDGWRPRRGGASANTDHAADAGTLRIRARALVQNSPYIARGIEALVTNTIGTGIVPRSMSKNAADIDALWNQWAPLADADGAMDVYGLQAAADRAMEQDGEVLVRIRHRKAIDSLPVPVQFQLLEIDWLDSSKSGIVDGNTIINGIEYDAIGRISFYWLFDQHPGEQISLSLRQRSSHRVPASSIIHLFRKIRPGQGRGITRLSSVIARTRDLTLYEDAEAQRKNLETRLGVIASGDVASMGQSESADLAAVRATGELGTLASGSILQVPAGNNITVIEPKSPPGYVDYVKFNLHLIAAGMGVTYEQLTGDMKEVNFSSARTAQLEFRRSIEQLQWLTIIPLLCTRMWVAFIDAAVLSGKINRADYAVDWATPKWDYVNPEQDVKADLAEISGGLSSISEKLRRRGYKPDQVFTEIKSDFDRLNKDGTLALLLQLQTGQPPQPDASAPAGAASRAQEQATTLAAIDGLRAQILAQTYGQQVAERTHTAPVINNHINVPEQRHEIHNHIATPGVEVRNQVNMPAPTVNVEAVMPEQRSVAPVVNITNQVQPADVVVNNTHPSSAVQVVERDANDEIARTVTTYIS